MSLELVPCMGTLGLGLKLESGFFWGDQCARNWLEIECVLRVLNLLAIEHHPTNRKIRSAEKNNAMTRVKIM